MGTAEAVLVKMSCSAKEQSGAEGNSLLANILYIVVLLSSSVSSGFVSPGRSVSVGTSPTLRYLLACDHLAGKPPVFSTYDIYTNEQVAKGLRRLQAALGLPLTGVVGEEERRLVKIGKCVEPLNKSPFVSPKFGITFSNSNSNETLLKSDRVHFEEAKTRQVSSRKRICQGDWVKKCSLKTNRPCSWFCTDKKKKARLWS